jgi:hypothetical protein
VTALYIGTAEDEGDYNNLDDWFKGVYPENLIASSKQTFDTFFDKLLNQVGSMFWLGWLG